MDISFFAHLMNGLLMIAMPVGLAFFLTWKFHTYWRLWWIGAGTFILAQIGHIPFNWFIGNALSQTSMILWSPNNLLIFNAVFSGLSAGLFEELFRYGMFRWWAKDARSWRTGILTGAGHGGAEAIIIGLIIMGQFINAAVLRNADLSIYNVSADQIPIMQQQLQEYWSLPWYATLLPALERALTIPVQIALAIIVLQTFTRKQWYWVWLAVLFHAFVDTGAVLTNGFLNAYWAEAVIGLFAMISIVIIFKLHSPEPVPEKRLVPPVPPDSFKMKPLEETKENLDKTRYR